MNYLNKTAVYLLVAAAMSLPLNVMAQNEGTLPTQALLRVDSKEDVVPTVSTINLQVNGKTTPITSLTPLPPGGAQVALLIDDGLSRSAGIELKDLRNFPQLLPPGTEVYVGYMRNGTVDTVQPFTTDHGDASSKIRLPLSSPGIAASPYFCLSEFVRHWPGSTGDDSAAHKARVVIMVTNGVDPYNGSTSPLNQDSPYVSAAAVDAQRAGVTVSSIYYSDAGFGGRGSFSGQGYLTQVADATGGKLYNIGSINPVSLKPYFEQFANDLSKTYVATFNAEAGAGGREHLVRIKVSSNQAKLKFRHADNVRPGNVELPGQ